MQKVRRPGGARGGGYPGEAVIARQLTEGAATRRVGLRPEGRAPVRGSAPVFATEDAAEPIGTVTSGCFGPSLNAPVAMGYVAKPFAETGYRLFAEVRGQRLPVAVTAMPFVTPNYLR